MRPGGEGYNLFDLFLPAYRACYLFVIILRKPDHLKVLATECTSIFIDRHYVLSLQMTV